MPGCVIAAGPVLASGLARTAPNDAPRLERFVACICGSPSAHPPDGPRPHAHTRGSSDAAPCADVNDGSWHMVTVTTHPNNSLGYSLYLDGR